MNGWIDEVTDGIVWGRVTDGVNEFQFHIPVLLVGDDQRVELEPNRYCSIVNGELLIDKTIWTTHDMEEADQEEESRNGGPSAEQSKERSTMDDRGEQNRQGDLGTRSAIEAQSED